MFEPEELMARIVDLEEQLKVSEMAPPAAEQLIARLEGEIAKRDARIVELEGALLAEQMQAEDLSHELTVIKAQEPVAEIALSDDGYKIGLLGALRNHRLPIGTKLYAAPVSEAKAQGEYGDAYQGAREDLAIWKRRALEAEEKVLQQEQIIDHLTSEAQGESRFGEPVVTPDAPCVPDGYVLADKKALGTVLQALVNAPHHIRELQVTRQPVELFSDNPINVLIANYEAPAAPAAPAADAGIVDMYRHLQKVTPYRFKKIQDASITDGGDVMYFHKDRFDAALLADMAAHCAAKGVV